MAEKEIAADEMIRFLQEIEDGSTVYVHVHDRVVAVGRRKSEGEFYVVSGLLRLKSGGRLQKLLRNSSCTPSYINDAIEKMANYL